MVSSPKQLHRLSGVRTTGRLLLATGLVSAASVLLTDSAFAQQAPVIQATGAAPTRDELTPVNPQREEVKPRVTIEDGVERSPCALDDPAYADIKVTLTAANFNNLGPVPASELTASYADYLGKELPISTLCRIRDSAATKLRALGYVAAVQVPVQRIENGVVGFEVLFAKVTGIRVVGKGGANERQVESYLSKLADGQFFNRFRAERYLLLARDIPGYDVRLSLKPAGTGAGDTIAEITLTRTPVVVDFSAQNFAAATTGRYGGQLRATFNGLTGLGDKTTISVYSTSQFNEQQIYQFGHELLIGGNGLKLGGRITYALTRPDLGPTIPKVSAKTTYANGELSYPFVRSLGYSIRGALGFDYLNQTVEFAASPLSDDKLRVAYVRFDMDAVDLKGRGPDGGVLWRITGSAEARQGLSVFNASINCLKAPLVCGANGFTPPSLPDGNPKSTVFRLAASFELHPLKNITFIVSPRAQFTNTSVFSFEQFSTGNYSIGRGFDPGAIVGDKGAGAQVELRVDTLRLDPRSNIAFQPYVFSDNAWISDKGSTFNNPMRLNSAGGGLRIDLGGRARIDMSGAVPLSTLPGEFKRRKPRFLVSISTTLLPWRAR